jgi:transketolase
MVSTALEAAKRWRGSAVWSVPCLKPLNKRQVVDISRTHRAIIVLEEHSILGGLGSAVAEIASTYAPAWICRIGINDRFSKCCGSYAYLMREHQLDVDSVTRRVQGFLRHVTRWRGVRTKATTDRG